jgi:LPXTG-motif cell wall-anchored protein
VAPVTPPDAPQAAPVVTTPPVTIPPTQDASDAPVAATATTTPAEPVTPVVKAAAEPTSLPFTGVNLMPFVLSGVTCVALGLGLLLGRRKRSL